MLILYIEDEPNDATLLDRYIRVTPHKLHIVTNMQDAKAHMTQTPDLLLVDVLIGQARQGYNFVRELRNQGYNQPIVAVTGLSTPYDIEQCFASGFNEVLTKPYTIDELADMINKYAQ
jgi:CheY-like chemotaxis protein